MSYEQLLTRYHWLQLSNDQRLKMREVFDIPKSGGVEMMNNKIISDGCNESDLKSVNIVSMKKFLEVEDVDATFEELFNHTILKIDSMFETGPKEDDSVDILMKSFNALSLEDQERVREAFREKETIVVVTPINNTVTIDKDPNVTIKKAGRPKKGKEGGNIEGTESTGNGNESTESAR